MVISCRYRQKLRKYLISDIYFLFVQSGHKSPINYYFRRFQLIAIFAYLYKVCSHL